MHRILLLVILVSARLWSQPAYVTFPSDVDWVTRSSEHFKILYRRGQAAFAVRALQKAEEAHRLLSPIFPEGPESTWIVLADFQDSLNGYALDLPYPFMVIFASPPTGRSALSSLDDWLGSVILHEYVHILHLYPASGLWSAMRFVFGSWVLPNGLMPGHFHEGMATMLETELSAGGRGRSSYYRMVQRMAVYEGVWGTDAFSSFDRMDGASDSWPWGRSSMYFFGTLLHKELWDRKGREGIYKLTDSFSSNWPYFLKAPYKEVYGVHYDKIWASIFAKGKKVSKSEIAEIQSKPLSQLTYLTNSYYEKWDVTLSPSGDRVAYRRASPKASADLRIREVSSGKLVRKVSVSGGFTGMCWSAGKWGDELFFPALEASNGYSYASLSRYDWKDEASRYITASGKKLRHIKAIDCNAKGTQIVVYQESAGKGWVGVYQREKRTSVKRVARWPVPKDAWITSVLAGKEIWFALRKGMNTSVYLWEKNKKPKLMARFVGHLYNLRRDGSSKLLALYDHHRRQEVWQLDFTRRKMRKRVALLGGSNSFDSKRGQTLISSYRHRGYDLAKADWIKYAEQSLPESSRNAEKGHQEVAATDSSDNVSEEQEYSPLGTLLPRAWVPSVLFVPDGVQFGFWIPGFDISQRHYYQLFGGYDTRGLPYASLTYNYRFWKSSGLNFNSFFSPSYIQSSRTFLKRWGGRIGYSDKIGLLGVNYRIGPVFRRLEEIQIGSNLLPSVQSLGGEVFLSKSFGFKTRHLAVSPIRGTSVYVSHSQYFEFLGSDDNYFATTAGFTQYLEAPWWNGHIFYLAFRAGYTEGSSLINLFYEGGGELPFHQARGLFLNRGYVSGAFLGRRIATANLEYRFPLLTINKGYDLLPFFLKRIHVALIADLLTFDRGQNHENDISRTQRRDLFKRYYGSVGLELKSDWTTFFYLPTSIRLGFYHGINEFRPGRADLRDTFRFTLGISASL